MLFWPVRQRTQRIVVECKVRRRDGLEATIRRGLEQTASYMDRCGADEGHLVVFDRGPRAWREKIFSREDRCRGLPIRVWGV